MLNSKSFKAKKSSQYLFLLIYIACFPLLLLGQADTTTSKFTGTTTDLKPEVESEANSIDINKEIIAVLDFSPNGIIKLEAEVLTNEFAIEINKTENN